MLNASWPRGVVVLLFAAALAGGSTVSGRELYVAPNGTPQGDGRQDKPLDLATAISDKSPAMPGDTLYLKGGRYDGPMSKTEKGVPYRLSFAPRISGVAGRPIVVTSAPGEWAHLNGTLALGSIKYVHFVRLEIGDLLWDPLQQRQFNDTAVNTGDVGLKVINCNIFGGAMGMGAWTPALNLEVYGNLIHDFGYYRDNLRGSGHAIYMQNDQGTKVIERNLAYRSCGWLFDIYTQGGKVNGFDIIENIGFLGGHYKPGQVSFAFGLTGWQPAERIRFIGNIAYQPRDGEQWRSNMRLLTHAKTDVIHRDAVVSDNYIMGAYRAMTIGMWRDIQVAGNTFWATGFLNEISSGPSGSGIAEHPLLPDLKNYRVDKNTYYETGKERPFIYGRHEQARPEEQLTFSQWQTLGFDKNGQLLPCRNGKPTGTKVFVFDNKYESGRGNVAVFNWDGKETIDVDLAKVLKPGQAYRLYNGLDIPQTIGLAKPLIRAKFDGKPVSLPMRKAPECPDFDAFLVLPEWQN
jgi:hypothetical protein